MVIKKEKNNEELSCFEELSGESRRHHLELDRFS
jgi:hypothetical protein